MAANKAKPKVALGNNPLSQSFLVKRLSLLFPTDTDETVEVASIVEILETRSLVTTNRNK